MPTFSVSTELNETLRGTVLIVQGLLLFGTIGFGLAGHAGWIDFQHPAYLQAVCATLLGFHLWSLVSWRIWSGVFFDPYTIFLSAAYVFNGGQAFLEAFGLNPQGILDGKFPPSIVMDAQLLVALCLISLHTGALLSAAFRGTGARAATSSDISGEPALVDLRTVGWCLLTLAFPAACYVLANAMQRVMAVGYLGLYGGNAEVGVGAVPMILGAFLVPASLTLLAGSKESFWGRAVSLIVLLIYGAGQLFLGFRYQGIMPLIAYGWVWHRCIRPLPLVPITVVGLVLAIVVFPIIRNTRNTKGETRSLEMLVDTYGTLDGTETSTLREMGGTVMVTMYVLELVPDRFDYDYGQTYGFALLTLMPNLFWDLHPSIAYGTRSRWLITSTDPWLASKGGSFGFSFIAEAYLAFGWSGAPWLMAAGGFAFARFVLWANGPQGLWQGRVAAVGTFINFFAFFAREESAIIMRPLVWYALLPYLAVRGLAWARHHFAAPILSREAAP